MRPGALLPGQVVASYTSYAEAQRAVDFLSDEKFAVEHVRIVGSDLRMIEQITGRLNWGRAALSGLSAGAWLGLMVGLILWLITSDSAGVVATLLWGLFWGAVFGLVFGVARYAMSGGQRDFTSRSTTLPSRFDVMVDVPVAEEAMQILSRLR